MAGVVRIMSTDVERAQELKKVVQDFADVMAKLVALIQHSGPELQGKSVADIATPVAMKVAKQLAEEQKTSSGPSNK